MNISDITGMGIGERRSVRADGRYWPGQVLHDDDPYCDVVLRVVAVSPPCEDDFDGHGAADVTRDLVVERIERSPEGQAAVDAWWARYREHWTALYDAVDPYRGGGDGGV